MSDLLPYQYGLIALLFVWGGFVRSGLGFGGAVLALPFLLLILNQPLVFLPIIAIHLLLFSSLTVVQNQRKAGAEKERRCVAGMNKLSTLYLHYASYGVY